MNLTSRRVTRIAFSVIILFVLAQVVWWIMFQNQYIASVTDMTLKEWRNDVLTANELLDLGLSEDMRNELLTRYPHLVFDNDDGRYVLNQAVVSAFVDEQRGSTRMFAYEGPVFIFVVLLGLWIIARSLRTERELKTRQQNFLSAITHEFKTPISTLRLLIETALMRKLSPEKQQDYLRRMAAELSRLEQTSEQVLAAARLEQSQETILEPQEMNSLVQSIVGRARSSLEARGAELRVEYFAGDLPVSIDASAFTVVLNNLLDNAVKYSPDDHKPILLRLDSKDDLVLVEVADQGMGIDEKEMKHVFEQFYRVGSEMTRKTKGVGLGLHLVKSIIEAMNGWVRVEANEPKGSRFTLVLPRRVVLAEADTVVNLGGAS